MEAAQVQAALSAAMQRLAQRPGTVHALQRLTGGATKQTWSFDWACGEGSEQLILQRTAEPAAGTATTGNGPPKLNAIQDAAMMVAARAGGVPAPLVRLVLDAEDGLGNGTITSRVDGETLGRKLVHDSAFADARAVLTKQCGAVLAAVHQLPTSGLPFLRRLSPADELAVYGGLLADHKLSHPALAYALRWVHDHLPTQWQMRVVHADFRTGNLIVGRDVGNAGLRCVLDWEIARIGDPMQDLGVLCMRSWRFGGAGEVGGFGTRDDLYAAYEAAGGGPVDPERVRFWEAFSNLKWAIACVRRGLSVRGDGRPASVELCAVGRRLEEPLWDFFSLVDA